MATPPEEFSIAARAGDGRTVLTVRGELDLATAPELEEQIDEALDGGREVVLDLRELTFMDSTGLRALAQANWRAEECGVTLAIIRGSPQIERVLEISGLGTLLPLVDAPSQ